MKQDRRAFLRGAGAGVTTGSGSTVGGSPMNNWEFGLGASWEGWRENDTLIQQHAAQLPDSLNPGVYQLWAGLYNPETEERWPVVTQQERYRVKEDRPFLGEFVVQ